MWPAGALIGPAVGHRLDDGGYFTVPEGHGVEPDIKIIDDTADTQDCIILKYFNYKI